MDALGFDAHLYDVVPEPWRHWLFERLETRDGPGAPAFSPAFIEKAIPFIEPLYKYYFRCEIRHMEKIPDTPPAFVVGNHNAMGVVEIPLMLYAWYKKFGSTRTAHGLAHRMVFRWPLVKEVLPKVGAVPADPDVACRTLGAGKDLLVFPGGDWEAARPTKDRKKIDFAGRKGFVKVALKTGVPVVPLVICGAHETALIFSRGDKIAHFFGLDTRQRLKALPVTPQSIFAVWKAIQTLRGKANPIFLPLWIANAWMAFPWFPSRITMELLDPIDMRAEVGHIEDEEERLQAGYDLVTGRMQAKLDELQAERRTFLG